MRDSLMLLIVIGIVISMRLAVQIYKCYKKNYTYEPRFKNGEIEKMKAYHKEVREYFEQFEVSSDDDELDEQINTTVRHAKRVLKEGLTLEEGISSMLRSRSAYRPYHIKDPFSDIRSAMREFTVGEVIKTFY